MVAYWSNLEVIALVQKLFRYDITKKKKRILKKLPKKC